jgi:hypothetical protein
MSEFSTGKDRQYIPPGPAGTVLTSNGPSLNPSYQGSHITNTSAASYAVLPTDDLILANGATNQDIILPVSGIAVGKKYRIKASNPSGGAPVNVQTADGVTNIDDWGAQYQIWNAPSATQSGGFVEVEWDGTQYWILAAL